jgi:DNA topoisomerase-1
MAKLLEKMKSTGTIAEKVKDYNNANREVAILCNHKRTVAAGHNQVMEKMEDKINGMRYQQWRIKQMMLDLDPKLKKKKGADFFALPEDLGGDWVKTHQESLIEQEKIKIQKKFDKENEKLEADGQKPMKAKELEERMEVVSEMQAKFKKENKTQKVEAEGKGPSVEKFATAKTQSEDRENNKEVALGTSKIVSCSHWVVNKKWYANFYDRTTSTRA